MGSDFLEAPFCNNRTPVILNVTRAGKFTFVMCMLSIIVCIVHNFGACIINFYHIRLFKVNIGRNTRKRCEICSKLTKTLERLHWRYSAAFVIFEHISHLFLLFLLLTLNKQMLAGIEFYCNQIWNIKVG